jgi:hypothetical protein
MMCRKVRNDQGGLFTMSEYGSETKRANHRGRALLLSTLIAVAVALLAIIAAPAMAAPGTYTVSSKTGATFPLLRQGNLVKGAAGDILYYLSTRDTGKNKLPFAIHFYNETYKKIGISTNGNIQLGVSRSSPGSPTSDNDCLPTAAFRRKPVILPFWDDLFFDTSDSVHGVKEGIYREVSGTAPHRKFAINWQGHRFGDKATKVLARVIFTEGSQNIRFVYGTDGGGDATIGVQSAKRASFTQFACNSGSPTTVRSGDKLIFTHSG